MAEDKKEELEAFESSAFEALERDFQEVLQELIGDKSLEHFRLEYEKLHRALKKSHESEKRLIKKCRELNQEIVSNAAKVQTALNLSKEDQATIGNLKKEIERAWKMVEASHEKEQRAKETIQNLKVEIQNLTHLVEQGAGLSVNQENTVNSLVVQRDELLRTRDKLEAQAQKITQDNIHLTEVAQRHEAEKLQGEAEVANMQDVLNAKRTEAQREMRRRERLERELSELKSTLQQRDKTLAQVKNEVSEKETVRHALVTQVKELRYKRESVSQEVNRVSGEIEDLKNSIKMAEEERKRMHQENSLLSKDVKVNIEEVKACTQELDKVKKAYEQAKRRKALDDDERHDLQISRAVLKSDTENLIREIEQVRNQVESDGKIVEDIMRERESLNRSVIRTDEKTKKQQDQVVVQNTRAVQLGKDVKRVKVDLQEAMKKVVELDKAREKDGIKLSLANSKHMVALEDLKNRDNKISELKKTHMDVKGKLEHQKELYESVRTDRNMCSKKLVESQDEIAEMKRKFKIMYHQIEQLKEEIKEKDQALVKEHHEHTKMQKQCESIKDLMEKAKKKLQQLQTQTEGQQGEIKKLESRIHEAEVERSGQKRKYEDIIADRDNLGTQLIRRNDELALLYEKIKIQQRTLQQGEIAYKQRLEESRGLQIKSAMLKRELYIGKQQVSDIQELKKEVFLLQRELLQERTKVKALSEELENPMNVHRWRKLEGSDPAMHEMLQKVKALQKRLIAKTEEVVEKDLAIQEKEKLYYEMKSLLASQPGPEVVEEVGRQQQSLKERTKQMKAMAAELNMYHSQLNDYKDEIERLTRELQATKRRYFEHRHREQLIRDTSGATTRAAANTGPALTGGSASGAVGNHRV